MRLQESSSPRDLSIHYAPDAPTDWKSENRPLNSSSTAEAGLFDSEGRGACYWGHPLLETKDSNGRFGPCRLCPKGGNY